MMLFAFSAYPAFASLGGILKLAAELAALRSLTQANLGEG